MVQSCEPNAHRAYMLHGLRLSFAFRAPTQHAGTVLGFPSLMDDDYTRSVSLPNQAAIETTQAKLGRLNGSALQEQMLSMLVLLRLCCVSSQSSAALVKLPVLPLLLDLLLLFRNSARHAQWQLSTLGLLQDILKHPIISRSLAGSRPLLTRFLQQLVPSPSSASKSNQLVSGGLMNGLWSLTGQLSIHQELLDSATVDILVQFASNASIMLVGPESWLEKTSDSGGSGSGQDPAAIAALSARLAVLCLLNLTASEPGAAAVETALLGDAAPAFWELIMAPHRPELQLVMLKLFWRLFVVGAAAHPNGRGDLSLQYEAILQSCIHSSCREDVVAEALRVLGSLQLPSETAGLARSNLPLRPLGYYELAGITPRLMQLVRAPISDRCASGAALLLFRYASDSPADEVHLLASMLIKLVAECNPYTDQYVPCQTLGQITRWLHQLLNAEAGAGAARFLLRDPAAVCRLLRIATEASMIELTEEIVQMRLEREKQIDRNVSAHSEPSFFELLSWQVEVLDLLLTLVAIAVPDEVSALLDYRMHEHLIATISLQNQLLDQCRRKIDSASSRWLTALRQGSAKCIRIILHLAKFRPSLLSSKVDGGCASKGSELSRSARSVLQLAAHMSCPYAVQAIIHRVHLMISADEALAVSHLLVLATDGEAYDALTAILSIRDPSLHNVSDIHSTNSHGCGFIFYAIDHFYRRIWPSAAGAANTPTSGGGVEPKDASIIFTQSDHIIIVTQNLCHVLARFFAVLDIDGPFFVEVHSPKSGTMSSSEVVRKSSPCVQSLMKMLVTLTAETLNRNAGGDCVFLLNLIIPLWHLSTSTIHTALLIKLNCAPILLQWLRWDAERAEPTGEGWIPPEQQYAKDGLRSAICGVLWCLSRLEASHSAFLRQSAQNALLKTIGLNPLSDRLPLVKRPFLRSKLESHAYEVFVLGILRNILLADASQSTCAALRSFLPWLTSYLYDTKQQQDGIDVTQELRKHWSNRMQGHTDMPQLLPLPNVKAVIDMLQENRVPKNELAEAVHSHAELVNLQRSAGPSKQEHGAMPEELMRKIEVEFKALEREKARQKKRAVR
eukprot:SAG11_NODE_1094_length_5900_cov_5.025685_2_plen_1075_part_00